MNRTLGAILFVSSAIVAALVACAPGEPSYTPSDVMRPPGAGATGDGGWGDGGIGGSFGDAGGNGGGVGGDAGGGPPPTDTGGSAACLTGGNVLRVVVANGGSLTSPPFSGGEWRTPASAADAGPTVWTGVWTSVGKAYEVRYSQFTGPYIFPFEWMLGFSVASGLDGGLLGPGTYNPAAGDSNSSLPTVGVWDGNQCLGTGDGGPVGQFIIDELTLNTDGGVGTITASFLEYCGGVQNDWVQGCVHFVSP